MLNILGSRRRLCGGLTRRDWLKIGSLGSLGLGLDDFYRLSEAQAAPREVDKNFGRAKSCILLLPYGSPPQHETFDPKPDAPSELRGSFKPISTSVSGVQICEGLPRIAKLVDRLTIVRSMTHPYPVHCTAYVTSGIPDYSPALETRPNDKKLWPYIGSVVDYVLEQRAAGQSVAVPRNMALPWKMNSRGGEAASVQAGPYAAFLGPAYDPVLTDFVGEANREIVKMRPYKKPHKVMDPYAGIKPDGHFRLAGAKLRDGLTLDRLDRRRSLLEQMGQARRAMNDSRAVEDYDRYPKFDSSVLASLVFAR
jgi:hypothetical protein